MVKVIFHKEKNSLPVPLREVPILKRNVIEENHCLNQQSPFDVCNFFSVLATPLSLVHCLLLACLYGLFCLFLFGYAVLWVLFPFCNRKERDVTQRT